jgi:hypothetical protein
MDNPKIIVNLINSRQLEAEQSITNQMLASMAANLKDYLSSEFFLLNIDNDLPQKYSANQRIYPHSYKVINMYLLTSEANLKEIETVEKILFNDDINIVFIKTNTPSLAGKTHENFNEYIKRKAVLENFILRHYSSSGSHTSAIFESYSSFNDYIKLVSDKLVDIVRETLRELSDFDSELKGSLDITSISMPPMMIYSCAPPPQSSPPSKSQPSVGGIGGAVGGFIGALVGGASIGAFIGGAAWPFKGSSKPSGTKKRTEEIPYNITDDVAFTVSYPSALKPGSVYDLDTYVHLSDQKDKIMDLIRDRQNNTDFSVKSKSGVELARGVKLVVKLSAPDFIVEFAEDVIIWNGSYGSASFLVQAPNDVSPGNHSCILSFLVDEVLVSRICLILNVVSHNENIVVTKATSSRRPIESAFISYASEDREAVFARLQGIAKVLPEMDFFIDVVSLHSGENWRDRLIEEINKRDIFYLFWSKAAKNSPWVDMEWHTALNLRGIDYISPLPLVSPNEVPPPKELGDRIHFNDWMLAYIKSS